MKMESEYDAGDVHSGVRMSGMGNEDASVHGQNTPFPLLMAQQRQANAVERTQWRDQQVSQSV